MLAKMSWSCWQRWVSLRYVGNVCNNDFRWVENWIKTNLWEVRKDMRAMWEILVQKITYLLGCPCEALCYDNENTWAKNEDLNHSLLIIKNLFTHPAGLNWWFSSFCPLWPSWANCGLVSESQHEHADLSSIFRLAHFPDRKKALLPLLPAVSSTNVMFTFVLGMNDFSASRRPHLATCLGTAAECRAWPVATQRALARACLPSPACYKWPFSSSAFLSPWIIWHWLDRGWNFCTGPSSQDVFKGPEKTSVLGTWRLAAPWGPHCGSLW